MIKSLITATVATPLIATSAFAGGYVNVESNSAFLGDDYLGTLGETHIGYEGTSGSLTYYVQGGPALVSLDDTENVLEFSAKVGLEVVATDNFDVYGEYQMVTGDDLYSNVKLGMKYFF